MSSAHTTSHHPEGEGWDDAGVTTAVATEESISVSIVEAVAEVQDADPLQLPEVLNDTIDASALNKLWGTSESERQCRGFVEFTFCEYPVRVYSDRTVVVRDNSA